MSSNNQQVLIVNNDETELQILASLMRNAGQKAITTWSGLEALELLKTARFDLILTSNFLPDIYIGEFLERVNNLPEHPCCIVTGESREWDEIRKKFYSAAGLANKLEN